MSASFTPGPWLMAAAPSSIVGWPIVAPRALGRVVAKLCYADPKAFGGKGPGDGKYNLESKANGRLIEAAPGMHAALEKIAALEVGRFASPSELVADARSIAASALAEVRGEQVSA